jgi:hypothetical protein
VCMCNSIDRVSFKSPRNLQSRYAQWCYWEFQTSYSPLELPFAGAAMYLVLVGV